ncbi:hypothetical protein VFPPC_17701 [Pochonia chlamydosporia 170]|uniref:Uncharacterized protein n=1 Tax=Pochonia chlamydosporia 170 TaxID=1380566 RepID=A0A219AQR5_METCM|nr:hypothetical protein VFPPC_17701 [Pochonia chlamydosporia 170]OWT43123.1 hypothetical protein VFPPC_17701 [Pochonia chlamydosporia 170]
MDNNAVCIAPPPISCMHAPSHLSRATQRIPRFLSPFRFVPTSAGPRINTDTPFPILMQVFITSPDSAMQPSGNQSNRSMVVMQNMDECRHCQLLSVDFRGLRRIWYPPRLST